MMICEGYSKEVPTIWTDGKAQQGRSSDREKVRREKIRDGEDQRGRQSEERRCMCAKVAKLSVFPMFCGSGGSKSRLGKAAGAEVADQLQDEKLHAVVARSTFGSENEQSTPFSDHFLKLL